MKLSSKLKTAMMAIVFAVVGVGAAAAPALMETTPAYADAADSVRDALRVVEPSSSSADLETIVKRVINTLLYVIGILAVVMIIIGGVQYATSAGDQAAVTKAKNTIIYGLVGLAIAVLAYAIVNFVLGALTGRD
ncbi:hypothetical protein IKE71_01155 [Candidatus Saccharibacteria bacterium]|nr:hypothetical protein [Candidatus Saccharibacteria bacterium]